MRSCIALLTLAACAIAAPLNQVRQGGLLSGVSPVVGAVDSIAAPVAAPLASVLAPVEAITGPVVASLDSTVPLDSILRRGPLVAVPAIVQTVVTALVDALVTAKVDVQALVANVKLSNTNLLDDILNSNSVSVLRRGAPVATVADIVALLSALVEAALNASVNVLAVLGNVGINSSSILTNIGNFNTIAGRGLLDVAALVKAIVSLVASVAGFAAADVQAAIANVSIANSTIASDILNGNVVSVL